MTQKKIFTFYFLLSFFIFFACKKSNTDVNGNTDASNSSKKSLSFKNVTYTASLKHPFFRPFVLDNKMHLHSAASNVGTTLIYYSSDGLNWDTKTVENKNLSFNGSMAVFNNTIYVVGAFTGFYSSMNGNNWNILNTDKFYASPFVFQNKIWNIKTIDNTETYYYCNSDDGVKWNTLGVADRGRTHFVINDKILEIRNDNQDLYLSTNGVDWSFVANGNEDVFLRKLNVAGNVGALFGNKFLIFEKIDNSLNTYDIWSSSDFKTWNVEASKVELANPYNTFPKFLGSVEYNGKLWLFQENTSTTVSVWVSQ